MKTLKWSDTMVSIQTGIKSISEIWKKEKRFKKQTWPSKIPHTHDRIISKKYSFMFMWQSYEMWIYFDIFFTLMTVVPPSDHLFVIFIFDAVFSHGRSRSVSGNVVDAIINVIVIIVFFFLFGVDIKAVYKFFIETLFEIIETLKFLFVKKLWIQKK